MSLLLVAFGKTTPLPRSLLKQIAASPYAMVGLVCRHSHIRLLLSLGTQYEQRGMRAQKVILRGPFSRPPTPFAHSCALSRCNCGSHRSARPLLGSENLPRSFGAASPCGCLALPGCCQRARENRP